MALFRSIFGASNVSEFSNILSSAVGSLISPDDSTEEDEPSEAVESAKFNEDNW